mmetsp:Transcript_21916/g.51223  ORF Transcript_21916/g.51223 Transcript_21916/m.51223 type:complete len:305 (+) Transcript_21916:87-1001(+)
MAVKLRMVKCLWGVDEVEDPAKWDALFARIKAEGFEAVETMRFIWYRDPKKWVELLRKNGLALIAQIHTTSNITSSGEYEYCTSCKVEDHVASFKTLAAEAASLNPILINVHSGHDSWGSGPKAIEYLTQVLEIGATLPCPVVHETHRQRLLYSPYSAAELLAHPAVKGKLRINADLSHWCCVCEHVFEEGSARDAWWPAVLAAVAEHCDFIHARVGHSQAPQICHPDDPRHSEDVAAHMSWWRTIWKSQIQRGMKEIWSEPEFGPTPYMPTLPWTNAPVANLWAVNNRVADLLREEFVKVAPK